LLSNVGSCNKDALACPSGDVEEVGVQVLDMTCGEKDMNRLKIMTSPPSAA
jgi:hypothetical protein